ncbi:hypothetical protein [Halonatronum saccharophilum]|uniref:hypothetical protein n=1 Tax=Halonatronum saccharophilum TaxID=150060 RepID=UPI0004844117|nr:hypothetical protein [Halonatronum saccharophilum]
MSDYFDATVRRIQKNFDIYKQTKVKKDRESRELEELGDLRVRVGRNRGRRLRELPYKDLEWLATRSFDRELRRAATSYLALIY